MLVIDTNIVSELMRPVPTPSVAAWIAERDAAEMYLTAVSEAELRFGVAILPAGKRRDALDAAMRRWLDLGFANRILPFDSAAARAYAEIAADRRQAGRPIGEADCQNRRNITFAQRRPRDAERAGLPRHRSSGRRSLDDRLTGTPDSRGSRSAGSIAAPSVTSLEPGRSLHEECRRFTGCGIDFIDPSSATGARAVGPHPRRQARFLANAGQRPALPGCTREVVAHRRTATP